MALRSLRTGLPPGGLPISVTGPTYPIRPAPPRADVQVVAAIRMAAWAVRLPRIRGCWPTPPKQVRLQWDGLQMADFDAAPMTARCAGAARRVSVMAEMVDRQAVGDWPMRQFVRDNVGRSRTAVDADLAVAAAPKRPSPQQAVAVALGVLAESSRNALRGRRLVRALACLRAIQRLPHNDSRQIGQERCAALAARPGYLCTTRDSSTGPRAIQRLTGAQRGLRDRKRCAALLACPGRLRHSGSHVAGVGAVSRAPSVDLRRERHEDGRTLLTRAFDARTGSSTRKVHPEPLDRDVTPLACELMGGTFMNSTRRGRWLTSE